MVWLNDEEYQKLNILVAGTTKSREAVLRAMISGLTVKEKPPAEYASIVLELRRIGVNLNQIAALYHKHGFADVPELNRACADLAKMSDLFVKTFEQEE